MCGRACACVRYLLGLTGSLHPNCPLIVVPQSLDAERQQRQQAEEQLEQLRRLVDERLMRLEGPGK